MNYNDCDVCGSVFRLTSPADFDCCPACTAWLYSFFLEKSPFYMPSQGNETNFVSYPGESLHGLKTDFVSYPGEDLPGLKTNFVFYPGGCFGGAI